MKDFENTAEYKAQLQDVCSEAERRIEGKNHLISSEDVNGFHSRGVIDLWPV